MQICQRTFSEAQVACIMKHALAGLAYLHNHNGKTVIHRDIKGANILVDSRAICKLADFGVSSSLDKSLGKNRTVIGTPHWMAPEVLTNDDYNEKADVSQGANSCAAAVTLDSARDLPFASLSVCVLSTAGVVFGHHRVRVGHR